MSPVKPTGEPGASAEPRASNRAAVAFDLLLITPALDALAPDALVKASARALEHAPSRIAIVLRAPELPEREHGRLFERLRALTRERGACLLCHARLSDPCAAAAEGIQLPERGPSVSEARARLGKQALIGASRHDGDGLLRAAREGASFATLSPLFPTGDKRSALGLAAFSLLARQAELPVFALGGVTATRAEAALQAGAHGVAAMRAVLQADDPTRAARELLAAIDRGRAVS